MKAAVYAKYGPPDVLRLEEVPKPTPGENELLIKTRATTVTAGDYRMRGYHVPPLFWLPGRLYMGIFRPRRRILGTEFAGTVEAVGSRVRRYQPGDAVFGSTGDRFGAHAEYIRLPEEAVVATKPGNMTWEEAAAIPFGGLTALFFLRDRGKIQSGQKVLINGASGGVGSAAVQLAKCFDAEVTGVCSGNNLEMVKSLGADHVIDYTREDFTRNETVYEMIFDTVGNLPVSRCKRVLTPEGVLLTTVIGAGHVFQMVWSAMAGGKKVVGAVAPERVEDLLYIKALVEAGKIKPAIDRRFALERIVEAHRYAEKGHKKGNVVIVPGLPN